MTGTKTATVAKPVAISLLMPVTLRAMAAANPPAAPKEEPTTVTNTATVSFPDPILAPVLIPVEHKATPVCIDDPFLVNGTAYKVTAMSFGSPHGAVFVDDVDSVDIVTLGAALGNHVLFPKGASIVFVQMLGSQTLKARLWQRGEGEMPSTPEAACVAGVAAMMLQKTLAREVRLCMGGEGFRVAWGWGRGVSLTGPSHLLYA